MIMSDSIFPVFHMNITRSLQLETAPQHSLAIDTGYREQNGNKIATPSYFCHKSHVLAVVHVLLLLFSGSLFRLEVAMVERRSLKKLTTRRLYVLMAKK